MIGRVRRAVLNAIGRSPADPGQKHSPALGRTRGKSDADRRLDAAHTRLKATIPPPPD